MLKIINTINSEELNLLQKVISLYRYFLKMTMDFKNLKVILQNNYFFTKKTRVGCDANFTSCCHLCTCVKLP